MNDFPEDEPREPATKSGPVSGTGPVDEVVSPASAPARPSDGEGPGGSVRAELTSADLAPVAATPVETAPPAPTSPVLSSPASDPIFLSNAPPSALPISQPSQLPVSEPQLFQYYSQLPARPPARIPHFGHVAMLIPIGGVAFICTIAALFFPMRLHWFGWSLNTQAAATNVSLLLASEAILYLVTFAISFFVFPHFWNKSFFAGLQWRGAVAVQRFWTLAATALGCAGLAALDEVLMPGPSNAPIEKLMSSPQAAWLMFGFGVTIAPFFEEMFFRGFLLPALCTAWDWAGEKIAHRPPPLLDANDHPQWSFPAMAVGSVLTSLPFAGLHVDQQGHALGPFLLLILVSLILCTVRLKARSLAASTLVHACYNFIIFSLALIGTGGFRHFDKM